MDYPFSKLEKQYKALPPDVRSAISSAHVGEKLMQIGRKYNLHVDTLDKLFGETGFVMLGLTHPKDYIKKISKQLGVDERTAREIATEVNEAIYRPIKESLKKMYSMKQAELAANALGTSAHEKMATPPSNLPIKEDEEKSAPEQKHGMGVQKSEPLQAQEKETDKASERPVSAHIAPSPPQSSPPSGDEHIDRAQVLKELEESEEREDNPPKDLLEKKLTTTFKNPKEKSEYIGTSGEGSEEQGGQPDKVDPYRESTE